MPGYKSYARRRKVYTLRVDGNISTGDGKDWDAIVGRHERLIGAFATLVGLGTTSGDTSVQIARVRAGSAVDLISATIDIAYNATTYFTEADRENLQNQELRKGDHLRLDIDSVPGAGNATDLVVKIITHVVEDEI